MNRHAHIGAIAVVTVSQKSSKGLPKSKWTVGKVKEELESK